MSLNRYAKKRDENEAEIVAALREIPGVKVTLIDTPCDLLVGYQARTLCMEVKMPGKGLNAAQQKWAKSWSGHYRVVTTVDEAVHCVLNCYRR